jgi:predicted DNA-binding protein
MEIRQATDQRQTKTIMLRLTPDTYDRCRSLSKKTKLPIATLCRTIIENALAEGIDVVPATTTAPAGK